MAVSDILCISQVCNINNTVLQEVGIFIFHKEVFFLLNEQRGGKRKLISKVHLGFEMDFDGCSFAQYDR